MVGLGVELIQVGKSVIRVGSGMVLGHLRLLGTSTRVMGGSLSGNLFTLSLSRGLIDLLMDLMAENLGCLESFMTLGVGDVDVTLQGVRDRARGRASGGWVVAFVSVVAVVHDG